MSEPHLIDTRRAAQLAQPFHTTYDGDGKRVKKHVPSTGEVTVFVYDAGGKLVAEYSTTGASQQDAQVSYLTNDHLGSPRITTDKNGKVFSRRDFMPFGEELIAAITPERIAVLGYGGDNVRQKFTGYERDDEIELDYAQARYFSSALARFSSPDPLLNSGQVGNPSSWNRYGYAFNNPLVFTDPTGMWVWSEELGGMLDEAGLEEKYGKDKATEIMAKRKIFIDALNTAYNALASGVLDCDQEAAVKNALDAYGAEQVGEGAVDDQVTVGFGEKNDRASVDDTDPNGRIYVNFNEGKLNNLFEAVAHEGSHVADAKAFNATNCSNGVCRAGGMNDITRYESERRAYVVSSFIAQAAGASSYPSGPVQFWNKGWKAADREQRRSEAIDRFLKGYVRYYVNNKPLTKDNPGRRKSERKRQ